MECTVTITSSRIGVTVSADNSIVGNVSTIDFLDSSISPSSTLDAFSFISTISGTFTDNFSQVFVSSTSIDWITWPFLNIVSQSFPFTVWLSSFWLRTFALPFDCVVVVVVVEVVVVVNIVVASFVDVSISLLSLSSATWQINCSFF